MEFRACARVNKNEYFPLVFACVFDYLDTVMCLLFNLFLSHSKSSREKEIGEEEANFVSCSILNMNLMSW